jgi:2-oxoglutarate ferredoxin oxidoreductase subunit delta
MKRKFDVRVNGNLCKKCGICVFICPKGVFSDDLRVDAGKCNGCRRCELYCPDFAVVVEGVRGERNEGSDEGSDEGRYEGTVAGE